VSRSEPALFARVDICGLPLKAQKQRRALDGAPNSDGGLRIVDSQVSEVRPVAAGGRVIREISE
jgi:hypothetical protein